MKNILIFISLIIFSESIQAQSTDTIELKLALSKYDTISYKRTIQFNAHENLYYVKDYFENGQLQMDATYSSIDKMLKEGYWCNYRSNTKEGVYKEWFENGQIEYLGSFKNGLREGLCTSWYTTGQIESKKTWKNGQLNGPCKYWTEQGDLQFNFVFEKGICQNPTDVNYQYIKYLPPNYKSDTINKWPLLIFLHGGAARGKDTLDLYDYGPFDQVYRGREFPFIIVAPQCPKHIRWSTENWFESFYLDLIQKYNIDTNRVYLTGASLGGSGTWYLAIKYPEKFAAIAPMSGFTSHTDEIQENFNRLQKMPVWAFHGKLDTNVPYEETYKLVNQLMKINNNVKFTSEPEVGHWIHHLVYPETELYKWFLENDKISK